MFHRRIVVFFCFLTLFSGSYAQISVDYSLTPAQLVQNVLLGGGVSVSNVTFTGGAEMRGTFEGTYCFVLKKSAGVDYPAKEFHGTITILKSN